MNFLKRLWLVFVTWLTLFERAVRGQPKLSVAPPDFLDTPLLQFSPLDYWTIRHACEGVQVWGATGSGKSSGTGAAIGIAYLQAGFGGIICCAKPEERILWEHYAKLTGREKDLIIFSPKQPWRFNFLNYELRREGEGAGQTENLINLLSHVGEIVEGKINMSGESAFWTRAMQELLRAAVDLLSLAKGRLTLDDICRLIAEAPQSMDDVGALMSAEEVAALPADYKPPEQAQRWWRSFCAECINEAHVKAKTTRERHDFVVSAQYWLKTFPSLSDRTRSGIIASFTGVADMLLHGFAWELFCTETNLVPEVTYKDGAIIILDLPVQEYHDLGRITQGIFKFMFQRAILRRNLKQYPRPVFLWADESQHFMSSFDFMVQTTARSAGLCTVYLSQNISNYYAVLGAKGRDESNSLLGSLRTQIFHSNSDHATNMYAADTIGQEWTIAMNFGSSTTDSGDTRTTGGNQTMQYKVLPAAFTTLRTGGPANRLEVEAIVFQGGRVWQATGDTYLKAVFKQR